jgi:integrase
MPQIMLEQKLPKYMSKEEVERFLQKAKKSKRDLALFYTIYFLTGENRRIICRFEMQPGKFEVTLIWVEEWKPQYLNAQRLVFKASIEGRINKETGRDWLITFSTTVITWRSCAFMSRTNQ